ncbi:phage virion morphogenesis protein [Bernardetia sp. Wsw4-3y2]|uniref:phage virion morphogenesis protein n=1 Tax=Bernardetia sp. Wsw4-3y2 TaxID=3127471 RepID=UPI0030D56DA6
MNIEQYIKSLAKKIEDIPTIVGNEVVNYSLDAFKKQGWDGDAWKARKPSAKRNSKRALLVDTGRLRRSIRIRKKGSNFVIVGSNVPYAPAHNQGAKLTGSVTVSSFTRKGKKRKAHKVSSHKRKMNTTIPQRMFLGRSKKLDSIIKKAINNHLKKASI